jgi:thiol-disulfide isomerase/thioredoxin
MEQRVNKRIAFVFLALLLAGRDARSQGMLPGKSQDASNATDNKNGVTLIGQTIPESLVVANANGTARTLLSFKAPVEVEVVIFFSNGCEAERQLLPEMGRFFNEYKDWHVSFVGINTQDPSTLESLTKTLRAANLEFPVVNDPERKIRREFNIQATPEVLVIDEGGVLRYRGPLNGCYDHPGKGPCQKYAANALDAVIGHIETVPHVEPDMSGGCPLAP